MEIYSATGVLKSGQLRVTKGIGALVVGMSQLFVALTNEKITIHIERANGSNEEVCTNILLSAFIGTSVFGEGQIITAAGGISALCELGNSGAVPLGENETIVISLTDLKSLVTYSLNGIELPVSSNEIVFLTEKIMLAGQKNRSFEVSQFDEAYIVGAFEKVRLTYETENGSSTVEYLEKEVRSISADFHLLHAGAETEVVDTVLSVVGVSVLEIFSATQVNIILRDVNKAMS
ncbi:MAG: hypothetical protein ACYCZ2_18835 [Lutibacter sp.]